MQVLERPKPWGLWQEEPLPSRYLLVEAAADGAPADLHESLRGDEHLVDPLPCGELS